MNSLKMSIKPASSTESGIQNPHRHKWDGHYQQLDPDCRPEAAHVLQAYDYLLPSQGMAIDLACGLGGNALFLARKGLKTLAWDLSPVALDRLQQIARKECLDLLCEVRDLEHSELPNQGFDVVVVSRYWDRNLNQRLEDTLRPGGLLYIQTFCRDKDPHVGPRNPAFLLEENELLRTFPGLRVRAYCEAGRVGDPSRGFRNEACLVAQKTGA
ncbi:MAG: class I SAM-dependent methyltransferase [Gammaproteobacteria bacterium]